MGHAPKPEFVFRRNGRVHLNRWGRRFSRLLAAEVCASAVVMLDTPCSDVVWRVLATHSIRQFPLHFPSRASPCAITFQLDSINRFFIQDLLSDSILQTLNALALLSFPPHKFELCHIVSTVLSTRLCRRGVLHWRNVYDKRRAFRSKDSKFGITHTRGVSASCLAVSLLCALVNLRNATVNVTFVCPSVRIELGPHRKDFHETWYLKIFRQPAEKIQISWKSEKKNYGVLTVQPYTLLW